MTTELLPIIDYVISEHERYLNHESGLIEFMENTSSYAKFLNTPLQLGQFVPCDENGNVMDAPDLRLLETDTKNRLKSEYKAAKDRVVFDVFEVDHNGMDTVVESDNGVQIRFTATETIGIIKPHPIRIKTISDLCGYGLKLKQR